jgi:hypothetical protein
MAKMLICHYEDEPHKVDFPGMIEVALYKHPGVSNTDIEEVGTDAQYFIIRFEIDGEAHELHYIIAEGIKEFTARSRAKVTDVKLHMVDMSINGRDLAGVEIVKDLIGRNVGKQAIWMVTAFEANARGNAGLDGITIYPKPSPFSEMTEKILALILPPGGHDG